MQLASFNDWALYTNGLWDDWIHTYSDPSRISPPWGLILLIPYYLITPWGARVASVLVIGYLCQRRGWSLVKFFAIISNPYFLFTMLTSNMDILVIVLPILIWERVQSTRWQTLGRGLALSFLLLKPQTTLLVIPCLLWKNRRNWRELIYPLMIVGILVVPISLVGGPPLILQWIHNLQNPSPINELYWNMGNVSLTTATSLPIAVLVVLIAGVAFYALVKVGKKRWSEDHTIASLLLASVLLSPYASNQSVTAAFVFIPSWPIVILISMVLVMANFVGYYADYRAWWVVLFGVAALFFYNPALAADKGLEKIS